ncbi:ABC transporter permease subunit [Mesorhizobium sp. M1227]|uniref:ABC transporter permease n=1 Tax=Mesorhizobium sp. M1227 TaxID=2957071 RepID=UPI00333B78A6
MVHQFAHNGYLWSGLHTSLLLATAATAAATTIGALAALAISRMSAQSRDSVTTAFLSPLVLPGVIIGFALLMAFSAVNVLPTFLKMLAGHLIITIPFTIRMTLIGLTGISATLREAALSLGTHERQAFFTITLPLAKNSIAAGAIFAFAFSMDDLTIQPLFERLQYVSASRRSRRSYEVELRSHSRCGRRLSDGRNCRHFDCARSHVWS